MKQKNNQPKILCYHAYTFFFLDKNSPNKEYSKTLMISKDLWKSFKISYSNSLVLKMCLWYIMGSAATIEVSTRIKYALPTSYNFY